MDSTLRNWHVENIFVHNHDLKRGLVVLTILIYMPVTRWAMSMFFCREVQGQEYLKIDMAVQCGDSLHTAMFSTGIFALSSVGFGLPAFYWWHARGSRDKMWDPEAVQKDPYSALYAHIFTTNFTRREFLLRHKTEEERQQDDNEEKITRRLVDGPWWWFLTELAKKLLLNFLFLHGINNAEPYQWRYTILLLLFVMAMLHEYVRPFALDSDNALRAIADLLLFWVAIVEILNAHQMFGTKLPLDVLFPTIIALGIVLALSLLKVARSKKQAKAIVFSKVEALKQRWSKASKLKYIVGKGGVGGDTPKTLSILKGAPLKQLGGMPKPGQIAPKPTLLDDMAREFVDGPDGQPALNQPAAEAPKGLLALANATKNSAPKK